MRVAFRTDGSATIGLGHVMRCLAVAGELRNRGNHCFFLMRDLPGGAEKLVEAQGFPVVLLTGKGLPGGDIGGPGFRTGRPDAMWARDAVQTLAALGADTVDWLVVDHYGLDAEWEGRVRLAARRVAVIDDLADRPHACDVLVDHNVGRVAGDYASLIPRRAVCLAGPRYAMLRPAFATLRRGRIAGRGARSPRRILVALGGGDQSLVSRRVLESIQAGGVPSGFRITVVPGVSCSSLAELQAVAARLPCDTEVVCNPRDFPELVAASDIAIGGGGIAALERCCVGLASVIVVIAENQRRGALELEALGAALVVSGEDAIGAQLVGRLQQLLDPATLDRMRSRGMDLVDGLGVGRIVDKMEGVNERPN